jgi:hypothetical protein
MRNFGFINLTAHMLKLFQGFGVHCSRYLQGATYDGETLQHKTQLTCDNWSCVIGTGCETRKPGLW